MEKHYFEPNQIPELLTRKVYVTYGIGKYNAKSIKISDYWCDPEKQRADKDFAEVLLVEKEITVELPRCEVDVKNQLLKILQREKRNILAENHRNLKRIEDEISNLLALEYRP